MVTKCKKSVLNSLIITSFFVSAIVTDSALAEEATTSEVQSKDDNALTEHEKSDCIERCIKEKKKKKKWLQNLSLFSGAAGNGHSGMDPMIGVKWPFLWVSDDGFAGGFQFQRTFSNQGEDSALVFVSADVLIHWNLLAGIGSSNIGPDPALSMMQFQVGRKWAGSETVGVDTFCGVSATTQEKKAVLGVAVHLN